MKPGSRIDNPKDNVERIITSIDAKIESLKTQFNLYFAGELRVPPELEREEIEKNVRELMFSAQKSPRGKLLVQNLSSKFSLYNNMWKKKLNEIESGLVTIKKKKTAFMEDTKPTRKTPEEFLDISLNREDSFDSFYDKYNAVVKKKTGREGHKEKVINSLKAKLISQNLVDAKVSLSVEKGKLKLKIKK